MTDIAKPEKKKETVGEMVRSFVFMVFLALIFRSFAYEPFHIPSGSMLSTLYEGDYIFVSKFSYGYSRFSFPFSPDLFDGRIMESLPKRGDVVVFRNPMELDRDYIKRVVGLPGDTVQMKYGRLYINGTMVEQTRRGEVILPDDNGRDHPVPLYDETLPEGRTHIVLDDYKNGPADTTKVYTVPPRHYFMMGDNRDHSQDSRFEDRVGYVPLQNIVGRAEIVAFSWKGVSGRWFKAIH
jgi:signal peptidase I